MLLLIGLALFTPGQPLICVTEQGYQLSIRPSTTYQHHHFHHNLFHQTDQHIITMIFITLSHQQNNVYKYSFYPRTIRDWNTLPNPDKYDSICDYLSSSSIFKLSSTCSCNNETNCMANYILE